MMRKLFIVTLSTVLLSGCLSPVKTNELSTYTLTNYPANTVAHKVGAHGTLLVTTPSASPGYQSSDMIYVTTPYQLKAFADHAWVAPPSQLLLPLLTEKLQKTGQFKAVVSTPFTGFSTYQLNTRVLSLQQEFLQPQSDVRLMMSATLVNTATGRVIGDRTFTAIVPAMSNNPYGGVLATNKAAHNVMNQIAAFVVKKLH